MPIPAGPGAPPAPDRVKKYALLAQAMLLRSKSYMLQAEAMAYCDVRTQEDKTVRIGELLDLSDDYARTAIEFDNVAKESNRILVVPGAIIK